MQTIDIVAHHASYLVPIHSMEISLVDYRLLEHPPSLVAAAAVWMARLVLERGEWTPTLVHYSSYSEVELLGTAEIMLDYCLRPIAHLAFHKKYSGRKFMRASVYVEDWARNTFPEGAVPDVEADTQDFNVLRIDLFDRMGLVRPDALLGVAEETYVAQVEAEAIPAPKEEPLHEVTNLRQAANQRRAVA